MTDTVDGFVRAGSVPGIEGRTINLGVGREASIGDLVDIVGRLLGAPLDVQVEEARLRPAGSEVERLLSDNTLAGELLGWAPSLTLDEGLERTITWIRDNLDRFREGVYVV